jgi:hypothetical protein
MLTYKSIQEKESKLLHTHTHAGSVDLPKKTWKAPQNTTKANWILHKHLNKHRNNEKCEIYVFMCIYSLLIKRRVNQRAIIHLVVYSCRIKHIYISGIVYFICFKCIYLSFCCSWLLLYVVKTFLLKLIKTKMYTLVNMRATASSLWYKMCT